MHNQILYFRKLEFPVTYYFSSNIANDRHQQDKVILFKNYKNTSLRLCHSWHILHTRLDLMTKMKYINGEAGYQKSHKLKTYDPV